MSIYPYITYALAALWMLATLAWAAPLGPQSRPSRDALITTALEMGWALIAIERLNWIRGVGSIRGFWEALSGSPEAVLTGAMIGVFAFIGSAAAWRRRDVIGHVFLLLAALTYLGFQIAVVGLVSFWEGFSEAGLRFLFGLSVQHVAVSLVTLAYIGPKIARRARRC